jgi:hypothetical protein
MYTAAMPAYTTPAYAGNAMYSMGYGGGYSGMQGYSSMAQEADFEG